MKVRALAAEFIGTFALCFVGIMSVVTAAMQGVNSGLLGVALAHGFVVAAFASATMASSGGHINPAVTVGMWISRRITFVRMIGYVAVQILAAMAAAWLLYIVVPQDDLWNANYGKATLREGLPVGGGILIEALLTFFLMYVILGTAVDKRATKMAGLFIGMAVALDILAGGPLTGAALNPSRWLAAAYMNADYTNWLVYVAGPVMGAALAAILYGRTDLDPS